MLQSIRKNRTINALVRALVRNSQAHVERIYRALNRRWKVAGELDLEFHGVRFRMLADCDDNLADLFYYRQSYEEENDLRMFVDLAAGSRAVLDVGANTGLYTLLAARANPQAIVCAFEPYLWNYRRLRENCALNNLANVRAVERAVGERAARINFTVPKKPRIIDVASANAEFSRKFYDRAVEWIETEVEQVALDDFVREEMPGERIDLVKIDVESYEMPVFRGMREILAAHRPHILFETFIDDERKAFFDRLAAEYDYTPYIFLRDGVLRLDDGFVANPEGLNFFLSPQRTKRVFIPFREREEFLAEMKKSESD